MVSGEWTRISQGSINWSSKWRHFWGVRNRKINKKCRSVKKKMLTNTEQRSYNLNMSLCLQTISYIDKYAQLHLQILHSTTYMEIYQLVISTHLTNLQYIFRIGIFPNFLGEHKKDYVKPPPIVLISLFESPINLGSISCPKNTLTNPLFKYPSTINPEHSQLHYLWPNNRCHTAKLHRSHWQRWGSFGFMWGSMT